MPLPPVASILANVPAEELDAFISFLPSSQFSAFETIDGRAKAMHKDTKATTTLVQASSQRSRT